MSSFIVCLANDGQFQQVTVDAMRADVEADTLVFRNNEGSRVAEFSLWAWYGKEGEIRTTPERRTLG